MATLEQVLAGWKSVEWESCIKELEEKVNDIADMQSKGVESRKDLVKKTKDFRNGLSPEETEKMGGIVRRYQIEIDQLSNRISASEQFVIRLYELLGECPAPNLGLAEGKEGLEKVKQLEGMVDKLTRKNKELVADLKEFEGEYQAIQSQEVTIRSLEAENLGYKEEIEDRIVEGVERAKEVYEAEMQVREDRMLEEKAQLSHRVGVLQGEADRMRARLQEAEGEVEKEREGAAQHIQALQARLQVSNERLLALEEQVGREGGGELQEADVAVELSMARLELARCREQYQEREVEWGEKEKEWEVGWREGVERMEKEAKEREERALASVPSGVEAQLEALASELAMFKQLHGGQGLEGIKASLKDREGEMVRLRVQEKDQARRVTELEKMLQDQEERLERQQEVIHRLEEDMASGGLTDMATTSGDELDMGALLRRNTDAMDPSRVVELITKQKGRFKRKVAKLEADRRQLRQRVDEMALEMVGLRAAHGEKRGMRGRGLMAVDEEQAMEEEVEKQDVAHQMERWLSAQLRKISADRKKMIAFVAYLILLHFTCFLL